MLSFLPHPVDTFVVKSFSACLFTFLISATVKLKISEIKTAPLNFRNVSVIGHGESWLLLLLNTVGRL